MGQDFKQKKQCLSCCSDIHVDARICPVCHAPQQQRAWHSLANILKWAGAITAVASLLLTLDKVNLLLNEQQQRQQAVQALIHAGELQSNHADYAGAWQSYHDAMQLTPGNKATRDAQTRLAMLWLRHIRTSGSESFSSIVDRLTPILYQGMAQSSRSEKATLMAHLGWASYLRYRENHISDPTEVDAFFTGAFKHEADNPLAHAMYAFWILYRGGELNLAQQHFTQALQSVEHQQEIRELQLHAMLNKSSPEAARIALKSAYALLTLQGEIKPGRLRRQLLRYYLSVASKADQFNLLISAMPIEQHVELFKALTHGKQIEGKLKLVNSRLQQ